MSVEFITIRRAVAADAEAACDVVRRSIVELCAADHQNDQPTLDGWLANKTVTLLRATIEASDTTCLVAVRETQVCGFAHMDHRGVIGLLYVAPEARFLGVSATMLAALEDEAVRLELPALSLENSATALRFYEARGYERSGPPVRGSGNSWGWPMVKQLR